MAIQLDSISSTFEVQERNRKRSRAGADPCILCEAPITSKPGGWIHVCLCCNNVLRADGERCPRNYNNGAGEDGRGGCGSFPVGSDCIKRVPKEYREK